MRSFVNAGRLARVAIVIFSASCLTGCQTGGWSWKTPSLSSWNPFQGYSSKNSQLAETRPSRGMEPLSSGSTYSERVQGSNNSSLANRGSEGLNGSNGSSAGGPGGYASMASATSPERGEGRQVTPAGYANGRYGAASNGMTDGASGGSRDPFSRRDASGGRAAGYEPRVTSERKYGPAAYAEQFGGRPSVNNVASETNSARSSGTESNGPQGYPSTGMSGDYSRPNRGSEESAAPSRRSGRARIDDSVADSAPEAAPSRSSGGFRPGSTGRSFATSTAPRPQSNADESQGGDNDVRMADTPPATRGGDFRR